MRFLPALFENNRAWARRQVARDPDFFSRLCALHAPEHLWIGCADSRVPANEIVGLAPGELFVHRNIANLVLPEDPNCQAVIQYAVEELGVSHVIVTGHYGCGGVQAAFGPPAREPLEGWIGHLRRLKGHHAAELAALPDGAARQRRLCELNVIAQVATLRRLPVLLGAWERGHQVTLHGWIYDLEDGLIRDLRVSCDGPAA
ncbi:carbonic anhydrase [Mesoterricola silvestris]|uniref:Carbonic anhydrase n=1 Tax=Mesoterricola silvestris TaxID=2927979 RepID=A0AA48GJZ9_9BACT|nr:carbonic anhydrase [Mesoterricola silvestris]BDU72732.1 carbonic anhydrase [Mesoterricola silvestris]